MLSSRGFIAQAFPFGSVAHGRVISVSGLKQGWHSREFSCGRAAGSVRLLTRLSSPPAPCGAGSGVTGPLPAGLCRRPPVICVSVRTRTPLRPGRAGFTVCLPSRFFFLKIVLALTDLLCCPASVRVGLSVSAETTCCPQIRRALWAASVPLSQLLRATRSLLLPSLTRPPVLSAAACGFHRWVEPLLC